MTTATIPRPRAAGRAASDYVVSVRDVAKHYPIRQGVLQRVTGQVRALDGVSFEVRAGETVGMVGESGCGKTTLGRCIAGLITPSRGGVYFDLRNDEQTRLDTLLATPPADRTRTERETLEQLERAHRVDKLDKEHMQQYRPNCQLVSQDPFASLNPRQLVRDIVGRPLRLHHGLRGRALTERVVELLDQVGLGRSHLYRYPHQFSGGQRQRISIARSLALEPKLIILDEPTSALDVSVQAQILNLLHRLQVEHKLTYLFISHDLNVVRHMSDRIVVMYLGKVCEVGTAEELFSDPRHPYTEALVAANPALQGRRNSIRLSGAIPSPAAPPSGCRFHTRCPKATKDCGWDVDDALRHLTLQDVLASGAKTTRRSPFDAELRFATADEAKLAVDVLGSPAVSPSMLRAMTALESTDRMLRVGFSPVVEPQLHAIGGGRETACLLHTGHRTRPMVPIP
jgi:oligopeptide/dipeptide ABC transporter ATP-binding protein